MCKRCNYVAPMGGLATSFCDTRLEQQVRHEWIKVREVEDE